MASARKSTAHREPAPAGQEGPLDAPEASDRERRAGDRAQGRSVKPRIPRKRWTARAATRVASVVIVSLVLGACVRWTSYPTSWPSVEPSVSEECPDIAGDYVGKADTTTEGAAQTLAGLLEIYGSGRVRISLVGQDQLQLALWDGTQARPTRVLSRASGDYACGPDGIRLRRRALFEDGRNLVGYAGWGWQTVWLNKSVDGSLIVREDVSATGVVAAIPLVTSVRSWYRFKPYRP